MGEQVSLRKSDGFAGRAVEGLLGLLGLVSRPTEPGDAPGLADAGGRETRPKRERTGRKSRAKRAMKRLRRDARESRERAIRAEVYARKLERRLRGKGGPEATPDWRQAGPRHVGQAPAEPSALRQTDHGSAWRGKAEDTEVARRVREGLLAAATVAEALARAGWTPPTVSPEASKGSDTRAVTARSGRAKPPAGLRPAAELAPMVLPLGGRGVEPGDVPSATAPTATMACGGKSGGTGRNARRRARRAERRRHLAEEAMADVRDTAPDAWSLRGRDNGRMEARPRRWSRSLPCPPCPVEREYRQRERKCNSVTMTGKQAEYPQSIYVQSRTTQGRSAQPSARAAAGGLRRALLDHGQAKMPCESGRRRRGGGSPAHSPSRQRPEVTGWQRPPARRHGAGAHVRTSEGMTPWAEGRGWERWPDGVLKTPPEILAQESRPLTSVGRLAAAVLLTPPGRPMRNLLRLPTLDAVTLQGLRL